MDGATLNEALRTGRSVVGTLIVSPSPHWLRAAATLGLDFVFIDTEHIALDRGQLAWMCQAYDAINVAPLVRIPAPDPYRATMALDGGARGIIVPYVEDAEQVRRLAGAVKRKPLKGRVLQEAMFGAAPLPAALSDYLADLNRANSLIVNVESRPALEALDEILAVEQLDAVLIGPHDLSCSLGVPEAYDHPAFLDAVAEIIGSARARNVAVGIHAFDPITLERELAWIAQGATLIVHGSDLSAFVSALRPALAAIREATGAAPEASSDASLTI